MLVASYALASIFLAGELLRRAKRPAMLRTINRIGAGLLTATVQPACDRLLFGAFAAKQSPNKQKRYENQEPCFFNHN